MPFSAKLSIFIFLLLAYACSKTSPKLDSCSNFFDCTNENVSTSSDINSLDQLLSDHKSLIRCGQWTDAVKRLQSFLNKNTSQLNNKNKSHLMLLVGEIIWKQGDDDLAENILKEALQQIQSSPDDPSYGSILYNLGEIYYIRHFIKNQPVLEEAQKFHYQSKYIRSHYGDSTGLTHSLSRIGVMQERARNIDSALYYYRTAISIGEALNYPLGTTRPHTHLGVYYRSQGDTLQAMSHFEKSLTINQEHYNFEAVVFNLVNINRLRVEKGQNLDAAIEQMECALKIARKIDFKLGIVNTLFNLGLLAEQKEDQESALIYYQKINEEAEQVGYEVFSGLANTKIKSLQ